MVMQTPTISNIAGLTQAEQTDLVTKAQNGFISHGLLGKRISANMNSTADQSIAISSSNYIIRRIVITNASTSLTLAAGGVYTAASKGGSAVVAAAQVYSALTGSAKVLDLTLALSDRRTETTLYLSLTTAQGAAATADIYIFGDKLD